MIDFLELLVDSVVSDLALQLFQLVILAIRFDVTIVSNETIVTSKRQTWLVRITPLSNENALYNGVLRKAIDRPQVSRETSLHRY